LRMPAEAKLKKKGSRELENRAEKLSEPGAASTGFNGGSGTSDKGEKPGSGCRPEAVYGVEKRPGIVRLVSLGA